MKNLPPWADAELSDALPSLAASGERQNLELKERFPEQARDLAKEIAAFATSNDGRILIGIADDGAIVGLPDAESAEGRGKIVGRIEGICSNSIKPNVTPRITFAVSDARVVACIEVPKGASPLYYVGGIPYLRQITAARGAEPDEVIEAVLSWHSARSGKQTPEEKLLSELASGLADVMIYASEFDDRNVGEWLDQLRSNFEWAGRSIRDLASRSPASLGDLATALEGLTQHVEAVAHGHLTVSDGWDEIVAAVATSLEEARSIFEKWIAPHPWGQQSIEHLRTTLRSTERKLGSLAERCEVMIDQNRLDEVKREAGELGYILRRIAIFGGRAFNHEKPADIEWSRPRSTENGDKRHLPRWRSVRCGADIGN